MFSEPEIEKNLGATELGPLRNLISHSFELTPFNEEDTANYIKHRLAIAGLTGDSPFTPAVVKVIYGTSHGIPSKINELSQVVLNNSAAAADLPPFTIDTVPKADVFKRYGLVGAITVLLIMVLAFQDHINSIFVTKKSGTNASTITIPAETEAGDVKQPPTQADTSDAGLNFPADNTPPSDNTQEVTQTAVGMVARNDPDSQISQQDKSATGMEGLSGTGNQHLIEGRDEREVATVDVVVSDKEKHVTTVMNTAGDATAAQASLPKQEEHEKQGVASKRSISRTTEPKPVEPQTAASKPAESKLATIQLAGTVHREDWLMKQDPQSYTLQLMAIREEATILKFIKDHDLQDQVAYFNISSKGKELLAVVYGVYPTKEAALVASKQLSEKLVGIKPWARTIASVRTAITTYQTTH